MKILTKEVRVMEVDLEITSDEEFLYLLKLVANSDNGSYRLDLVIPSGESVVYTYEFSISDDFVFCKDSGPHPFPPRMEIRYFLKLLCLLNTGFECLTSKPVYLNFNKTL